MLFPPQEFHDVVAAAGRLMFIKDGHRVFSDGSKKTLGLIYPGNYHFGTEKAERMEIISGSCGVKIDNTANQVDYTAGNCFDVPAHSGFDISVPSGICEYICSFLD